MNYLFLHGFWGAPSDWNEISERLEACLPGSTTEVLDYFRLVNATEPLTFETMAAKIAAQVMSPSVVVGYSLGGRVALHVAKYFSNVCRGVVLLSTHPGLQSELEKTERKKSDKAWAQRFATESFIDLERAWSDQAVFRNTSVHLHSHAESIRANLVRALSDLSLADQEPFWSCSTSDTAPPERWLFGAKDEKFSSIYSRLECVGERRQKRLVASAGHRVFLDNPTAVVDEIVDFTRCLA